MLISLGEMTREEAQRILMYGKSGGYTDEQIAEAYQIEETAWLRENPQNGSGASISVPPMPTYQQPAQYPKENCHPTDSACVARNTHRSIVNQQLHDAAMREFSYAGCKHNNALNINAGHPEHALDCDAEYPPVHVDHIAGENLVPWGRSDIPVESAYIPPSQAVTVYTDSPVPQQPAPAATREPVYEASPAALVQPPSPAPQPGVVPAVTEPTITDKLWGQVQEYTGEVTESTGISPLMLAGLAAGALFLFMKGK